MINSRPYSPISDDGRAQVRVGVVAAEVVFADRLGKVQRLAAGMQIHALIPAGGDPLLKDVDQVLLQRLQTRHGHVERAFLRDDGAGGVVRVDDADAVLHAGLRGDLLDLLGHIVERHRAVTRLELQTFSVNHISPPVFSDRRPRGAWRRSFRRSWRWGLRRS